MLEHCFYFPVNIYSCKQRNRCNQTVPTKISQDYPRPMLWDSIDLTKKSAVTWSLNNIIPVLYSLGFQCSWVFLFSNLLTMLKYKLLPNSPFFARKSQGRNLILYLISFKNSYIILYYSLFPALKLVWNYPNQCFNNTLLKEQKYFVTK